MNIRLLSVCLLASLPCAALRAQEPANDPGAPPVEVRRAQQLAAGLEAWRAQHGASWQVVADPETGLASFVYGGRASGLFAPRSDADAFQLARDAVAQTAALHGVAPATLADGRVVFLPLANAGSTDKITVELRQEIHGVRVVRGTVNVLLDVAGGLLSVDSSALPELADLDVHPALSSSRAGERAVELFRAETGLAGSLVGGPELVIDAVLRDGARAGVLAWQVEVLSDGLAGAASTPRGLRLRIDARDGSLTSREELVHSFDVSGNVRTFATPGNLPDEAGNPPTQIPLPHVLVTSAQGNSETDINGNFNIVGATPPLNVTVRYDGSFTTTVNNTGPTYALNAVLPTATGNNLLLNPGPAATVTAEANSCNWIGRLRDWTRSVNPSDTTADFDALSNVNLAQTCNAYYSGGAVNFFLSGGGCVNTAYSTVIAHEMGHWLNDRYGSGNGPDGFGEGNADDFAMYLTDNPIVGQDFCGIGCNIRTGLNSTAFCGDNNGGCHGEVHADGEVIMGALWKVRARLKTSLGNSAGAAAADTLFNAWMNAYNDGQIKTIVETHWLTLDDNDGDIGNGTPHHDDIDGGFRAQGFPGHVLIPVSFTNVTQLGNTQDQVGPYVVNATISANIHPPLVSPQLFWRVNGGPFNLVNMTSVGGSNYTAAIPGQVSPAKVEYYLRAQDANAVQGVYPIGAPVTLLRFVVGVEHVFYANDFENGAVSWYHSASAGADDWQLGVPQGKAGDPPFASSGVACWGNDLGSGSADGAYGNGVDSHLFSPPIDLTSAVHPLLRFKRWLNVQDGAHDQARVLVNGVVVYANPPASNVTESAWKEEEIDISAAGAGQLAVLEWTLTTDASVTFGGWNLDDVQIVTVDAVGGGCLEPVNYCVSKPSSIGTLPNLRATGAPSATLNNLHIEVREATYNKTGLLFYGASAASQPFQGGTLCVQPPLHRGPSFVTDFVGYAPVPIPITPGMIGTTRFYQGWFRDPADPFGVGLTNGLRVTFCN